jgi:hypothetical protein
VLSQKNVLQSERFFDSDYKPVAFQLATVQISRCALNLGRRILLIQLLQKFPEPGRIVPDDIDQKHGGEGKKKNSQVQQQNDNANQDPLLFIHVFLRMKNGLKN